MAIEFPNNPTQGQVYTPGNQVPYTYALTKDSWTGQIGASTTFGVHRTLNPTNASIITSPSQITGDGSENNPFLFSPSTSRSSGNTIWSTEYIKFTNQEAKAAIRWIDQSVGTGLRFVQPYSMINKNGELNLYLKYQDTPLTTVDGTVYTGNLQLGPVGPYFRWVVTQRV